MSILLMIAQDIAFIRLRFIKQLSAAMQGLFYMIFPAIHRKPRLIVELIMIFILLLQL